MPPSLAKEAMTTKADDATMRWMDEKRVADDFLQLAVQLEEEGWFKSDARHSMIKAAQGLILYGMVWVMVLMGKKEEDVQLQCLAGVVLGLFWHQMTLFARDASHNQAFENPNGNYWAGIIAANASSGISFDWIVQFHCKHWGSPQSVISQIPQQVADTNKVSFADRVLQLSIIYQVYLFYPVLLTSRAVLFLRSINHVLFNENCKGRIAEALGILMFVFWWGVLLSNMCSWRAFIGFQVVSYVCSCVVHLQACVGRFCAYELSQFRSDTIYLYCIRTFSDIDIPSWQDWCFGDFQFQTVHQMFPKVPRFRLRELSCIVRSLCDKHNVSYRSESFIRSYLFTMKRMKHQADLICQGEVVDPSNSILRSVAMFIIPVSNYYEYFKTNDTMINSHPIKNEGFTYERSHCDCHDVNIMQAGAYFNISNSAKNGFKRKFVRLSGDRRYIEWKRAWYKSKKVERVELSHILRVQKGQHSTFFERAKEMSRFSDISFSLIYGDSSSKSVDFVASSYYEFQYWYAGLSCLVDEFANAQHVSPESKYLHDKWNAADCNGDGVLTKHEVFRLVYNMNLDIPKKDLVTTFRFVDKDDSKTLNFQEYCNFMNIIRVRQDLVFIWSHLSTIPRHITDEWFRYLIKPQHASKNLITKDDHVSWQAFIKFWTFCQRKSIPSESSIDINISGFVDGKPPQAVSYNMFNDILCSCYAFDSEKKDLYQDMTRPLPDYYIATSHNTYLTGDQLQSQSSCQRYIDDLVKGCRCVEIDTWDGGSGENFQPVVYHGHTLTSKVSFADVVETCAEYCFKTSPYPVILSLENHCSLEQQGIMADILKEAFGDMLMLPGEMIGETLPSPEQLRNRVLVKGRRHRSLCRRQRSDGGTEYFLGERCDSADASDDSSDDEDQEPKRSQVKASGDKQTHPDLEVITYLKASNMRHWKPNSRNFVDLPPDVILSCSESKLLATIKNEELTEHFTSLCCKNLIRCYPKASRINSSNMNPLPFWALGGQCAALNYQTHGPIMHLNNLKFDENGKCGYVQRPEKADLIPRRLNVNVISAQLLPKPENDLDGEIIDPYVVVQLFDPSNSTSPLTRRTRAIRDNGFNPMWNEMFSFDIENPWASFLYFIVMDYDGVLEKDDYIGYAGAPISCLNLGFEHFLLHDLRGERGGDHAYATVFCHIQLESQA